MNEQQLWWKGKAGDSYTHRNRVDWRGRLPFWRKVIDMTGARSIFEMGCNAGWNLSAIESINRDLSLFGNEINANAHAQAEACGFRILNIPIEDMQPQDNNRFELVFTAGVLIHVPPSTIIPTMQRLINLSCDYVLAVEYEAAEETMIPYRNEPDRLWKRDYGAMYVDLGLELEATWPAPGFDNATAWLLRKP